MVGAFRAWLTTMIRYAHPTRADNTVITVAAISCRSFSMIPLLCYFAMNAKMNLLLMTVKA